MASHESNEQSPKKRNACDRCHTLKSRCTRQPGMESCDRCVRLAMTCVYSPPLRLGRPRGSKRGVSASRRRSEGEGSNDCGHIAPAGQSGAHSATASAAYLEPYESYDSPFSRTPSRQSYGSPGFAEAFSAASQPASTYYEAPAYLGTAGQYGQNYYIPSTSAPSAPNTSLQPHGGNIEDARSYQIHHLRMRLEHMLSSLPRPIGETAGPFSATQSAAPHHPGLDQILSTTEELIGVINQLRVETSAPQGLGLHEGALLGFNTTPSVYIFPDIDTNSFVSVMTSYVYVLKLYEPIIMLLYMRAEQQQQQHPHAGTVHYSPTIPNINLGSLTLTASADSNTGLVVNLIYQAVERLQAALHPLLPSSSHSPTGHQADGAGGQRVQGVPPASYSGAGFPTPGCDATTQTVELALQQVHSQEQHIMGILNMVKAILSAADPQVFH